MANTTGTTILLVEDEAVTALAEAQTLERHGYAVITAHSGEEALEALAGNPAIDIVIMDVDLGPGMDGPETAEKILERRDIPVLFLSSHTEPEIVDKTERITSYGYVVKHTGITVLLASIRMAFRLHRAKLRIKDQRQDLQSAIEELEATNEELARSWGEIRAREEALRVQYDLSLALNTCTDLVEALGLVLDTVLKFECIDSGGVYLADPGTGALDLVAHSGLSSEFISRVSHFDADTANVRLALAGKARYIPYDEIRPKDDAIRAKEGLHHLAFIPVFHQESLIAVLNLASHSHDSVPETVRHVLESLALQIGGTLVRIRSIEKEMESRERHRSLIENLPIGIFRTTPGPRGRFIMANSAFARMCGYDSVEEVLAIEVAEVYADRSQRAMISDELDRHGQFEGKNILFRKRDGTTFLASVSTKAFGEPGAARHFDGWMIDITERMRIENALKESLRNLQRSQEISHVGDWILDLSTERFVPSLEANRILGFPPDAKPTIKEVSDLIHEDDRESARKTLAVSLSSGAPYRIEIRIHRKDTGELRHVLSIAEIERDPEGRPVKVFGINQDITERKTTEDSLRNTLAVVNALMKNSPNPISIFDKDGTYIEVSSSMAEIIGLPAVQIRGKKFHELLTADMASNFMNTISAVQEKQEFMVKSDTITLNGEDRIFDTWLFPVEKKGGEILLFGSIAIDVTERQRADVKLRESKELLELFFSQSLHGFFFMTLDEPVEWNDGADKEKALDYALAHQRITRVNRAMVDQYRADDVADLLGLTSQDLFAHDPELGRRTLRELFDRGHWHVETDERRLDGSRMWTEGDYICLYDARGRITGHFGVQMDVTERKKAEERIRTLLEEKELLLRETHHRVKNNLGVIQSLLNLQSNDQEEGPAREILADAAGRVHSMAVLYDRLYQSDIHHELSLKKYLPPLIKEIIGVFHAPGPVKTDLRIDDIVLNAGKLSPIGIIINELITNSMKHAFHDSRGGRITVRASKKSDDMVITYADSGPGLHEAISFENSPTFGLQLVRLLVAQLGGTITVEKEKGTKYVITFSA